MDNASSHRHQRIKDLVNKENEILYSVHINILQMLFKTCLV